MRVLFLTHRLPYAPNRGDRLRAFHILKTLKDHAQVDVLSLVHDAEEARHADDLSAVAASVTIARVPRVRNVFRGALTLPGATPLTHALLASPDVRPALEQLVRRQAPDVVLAYCSGMARFALQHPLDTMPCVLDMVDVDSEKWRALVATTAPPRSWLYSREARRLRQFEIAAVRHARATLVVNDRERETLAHLVPEATIHTVPNGVDVSALSPTTAPSTGATVVFCGVMNYAPNEAGVLWFVRQAWPLIRKVRPDARFLVVGSDPTPAIQRLHQKWDGIEVTGAVADVRPYLWQSAVSIAPLQTARGIQNKVLEALAAGLPCVVTPRVFDGVPAEAAPGVSVHADATEFSAEVVRLLGLSGSERRAVAARATLEGLGWEQRLAPLVGILHAAMK